MDEQILKTIQDFYGEIIDIKTDEFYERYTYHCAIVGIKPRSKSAVIREACQEIGLKTKQRHITYTVFCEGD